ncbi:hypothetical protein HK105_203731 [Polyrhizophydium stewartii]|uniref:Mitochondrial import receptor subunit TOM22 homolog n=1 Tax=Polyrhizophydium stewartii TaxID=2732419 RepID=A0ABR4NAX1_9FUNG
MVELTEVSQSTEDMIAQQQAAAEKAAAAAAAAAAGDEDDEAGADEDDDDYEEVPALGDAQGADDDDEDDEDDEDVDEDGVLDESLFARLSALVDVIPPTARARAYTTASRVAGFTLAAARLAGTAAWVLSTASLLVFLPMGLAVEREQVEMMQMQQFQQQQNAQKGVTA